MNFPKKDFDDVLAVIQNPDSLSKAAKKILGLIDLTTLSDDDTDEKVLKLCQSAQTSDGSVAAVCVYSQFVPVAKLALEHTDIRIATVVNFPKGNSSLNSVLDEIKLAIQRGADEIDVVFPYQDFLNGKKLEAQKFIRECKTACGLDIHLKVILETGAYPNPESIFEASELVISAGADFLKTSTGKIQVGATLEAAAAMILAIKMNKRSVGFKASGGVRQVEQAYAYLSLAAHIMGDNWATPETFRFGASSLLKDVLAKI